MLRLLMMPSPLTMSLAHLSAHLLTLTADDDGAGRLYRLHADARTEERHHTYEMFLDRSAEINGPEAMQPSAKYLDPLLKLARELFAWPLQLQGTRINLECDRGPEARE